MDRGCASGACAGGYSTGTGEGVGDGSFRHIPEDAGRHLEAAVTGATGAGGVGRGQGRGCTVIVLRVMGSRQTTYR